MIFEEVVIEIFEGMSGCTSSGISEKVLENAFQVVREIFGKPVHIISDEVIRESDFPRKAVIQQKKKF